MRVLIIALMLAVLGAAPAVSQIPDGGRIEKIEFRDTSVSEALRLISELTGANVIATAEAGNRRLSMIVRNTTVRGAIASIARVTGLSFTFDRETQAFLLLTPAQFSNDVVVIRDGNTRIFTLRHQNVVTAALIIRNLFGDRVSLNLDTEDPEALVIPDAPIQESRNVGDNDRASRDRARDRSSDRTQDDRDNLEPGDLSSRQLEILLGLGEQERVGLGDAAAVLGLEPTIFITINREHNLLFVRTADNGVLESIQNIIRASDRPTKQVLLEMKILSLNLDDEFRSIFNFGLSGDQDTNVSAGGIATSGATGVDLGGFALGGGALFFQFINENLLAQIELLERENRVETVATPLLVASNNSPAELFVGDEAVLVRGFDSSTVINDNTAVTTNTTETEIREVGQTLEIIPRVNSDNTVTLVVRQEASTVIQGGANLPFFDQNGNAVVVPIDTVNTARAAGTVTALNGSTIAFGGLVQKNRARLRDQVPLLGDIPILGTAFRGDEDVDTRSELVILITPHVYATGEAGEAISRARLADLSGQADIDREGFGASANRTPATNAPGQQQSYVSLTRYAAARAHGILPERGGVNAGITETELAPSAPLVFGTSGSVFAEPVAVWRKGNLYVTTILLENVSDIPATLDPRQLRGAWLAATLESDVLAPRGQSGSRNYLYLLSNQPYEQVLSGTGIGGAL